MNWVLRFPDALVPKTWRSMTYATKFFEWMDYTEDLTIGQCEGNNGKIYEGLVLGVAKRGRRQGMALSVMKFQDQIYKIRIFFHKNKHTQRESLNFENWCNGEVS